MMVPCGAMDPVNVHNRIATNEEETCETKKNIPFFWAFLMHIISTEIFLDLGQFFLRPWKKKQKTMVLKYCTCVILFWSKQNDN